MENALELVISMSAGPHDDLMSIERPPISVGEINGSQMSSEMGMFWYLLLCCERVAKYAPCVV